jgi:hypothetical protein
MAKVLYLHGSSVGPYGRKTEWLEGHGHCIVGRSRLPYAHDYASLTGCSATRAEHLLATASPSECPAKRRSQPAMT